METLYILDPTSFSGRIVNTMKAAPDDYQQSKVDYTEETFEQYNARKGGNLIAIPFEQFYEQFQKPYLTSLCGDFKETTEEAYWDALECLPPMRFTQQGSNTFFFISEAYTDSLHSCYVKLGNSYYSALRCRFTPADQLFNLSPAQ